MRRLILALFTLAACSSSDEWPAAPQPRRAPSKPTHECAYSRLDGEAGTWQNGSRVTDTGDAQRLCEAQMSALNIGANCQGCKAITAEHDAQWRHPRLWWCRCGVQCIGQLEKTACGYYDGEAPEQAAGACMISLEESCRIGPIKSESWGHCRDKP